MYSVMRAVIARLLALTTMLGLLAKKSGSESNIGPTAIRAYGRLV
jgi:hypothetical protein